MLSRATLTVSGVLLVTLAMVPEVFTTAQSSSAPAPVRHASQAQLGPDKTPSAAEHPPELVALAEAFRAVDAPARGDTAPDYAAVTAEQKRQLPQLRQRLEALKTDGWPIHMKVDYLLLRSEMDELDFDLRVFRHHSRNPSFYTGAAITNVGRLLTGGRYFRGDPMPYSQERARAILRALGETGRILAQGRANLTEIVPEFVDVALRDPNGFAGSVYFQEAGALKHIGKNYEQWAKRTAEFFPPAEAAQLVPAAAAAAQELLNFGNWLEQNRAKMNGRYAIGINNYEWYLRHVLMMPYTTSHLMMMSELERARTISFLQFESHKNRHLPPIEPAEGIKQMQAWDDETALIIRRWYVEDEQLLSDIGHMPPVRSEQSEYMLPFGMLSFSREQKPGITRVMLLPPGHHNWVDGFHGWYIDPGTLHGHEYWPGHSLEAWLHRKSPCPIRREHRDGAFSQGWCNYHEELPVLFNFPYVRGPRAREMVYQNILWRTARITLGVRLMKEEITPDQAIELFQADVPGLGSAKPTTRNIATREIQRMLRQGLDHGQTGRNQILKLLADRKIQLKDKFDLREFHDQLITHGSIPVSLLRWEITGLDDEVKDLWVPRKLPAQP